MNTKIIKVLVWKEWHEQRGRLAFCCVILLSLMAIGLNSRLLPDYVTVFLVLTLLGSFLLPIFVVMGLIAPEREDRTLDTLMAQPLSLSVLFGVKLVTGIILCIGPILGSTVMAGLMAGGRELTINHILYVGSCSVAIALVFFIWLMALSCHQISEARAAIAGFITLGICLMALLTKSLFIHRETVNATLYWCLNYCNPFSLTSFIHWYPSGRGLDHITAYVALQAPIVVGLLLWAAWRFKTLPRKNK
jgi:ABC-type transport system involved in multi-copper enzyme maturation permease subunit